MIVSGKVEEAVEDEDFDLGRDGVAVIAGLLAGGVDADGQIAGDFAARYVGGGKGEDVRRLVLVAEVAIEGLDLAVGCEKDADCAPEADGGLGFAEECAKSADGGQACIALGFAGFRRGWTRFGEGSGVRVQVWVEEDHRARGRLPGQRVSNQFLFYGTCGAAGCVCDANRLRGKQIPLGMTARKARTKAKAGFFSALRMTIFSVPSGSE
jgi:hypothetical protein